MKKTDKDILQNPCLKENPFTVPPGYFSRIEDQVHAEISLHKTTSVKSGRFAVLKTHFALAATFALILGIGYGFFHLTGSMNRGSDNFPTDENAWLQDSLFSESLLEETLGNMPLDESEILEIIQIKDTLINTEEIEQYLIDSNVPLVTLASLE